MRAAALHFAERFAAERPAVDAIFASSMLHAAELRGLLPPAARGLTLVLYFHENQFHYPVQVHDERDFHFGWSQALSALSAELVLWNSTFNRDSFLDELQRVVALMPDAQPAGLVADLRARSQVLPVPIDATGLRAEAERARAAAPPAAPTRPCRILWNHRWEHDKGPDLLFDALNALAREGVAFEVAVLGQRFVDAPEAFVGARAALGDRVVAWGYRDNRDDYVALLASCDVALSTARHEFQGLAVLEAAACGAVPLVPDALAYREIWPAEYRYSPARLQTALRRRIDEAVAWRAEDPLPHSLAFDWTALQPRWESIFRLAF